MQSSVQQMQTFYFTPVVSSFFFYLAYSQQLQIGYLPYFHTWCGLSANLECSSEMCCTRLAENSWRKNYAKKSPSAHHRTTLSGYIFATKACIVKEKRLVKKQYLESQRSKMDQPLTIFTYFYYIFILLFFPRLISAVADWMSAILPHMVWPWCKFRMQVWNVLHAAHWKHRMQKSCQKLPSGHHRTTLLPYIFATKARIGNRQKTC